MIDMIEKYVKTKSIQREEDDIEIYKGKDLLVDIETYLKSGVHIGTKFKTGDMRKYIFKKRKDGLMVFNIETIDKRIRLIAKILAKYEVKDIAIVCRKLYGQTPIKKFASLTGTNAYIGRFIPGTITNPEARSFYEPKIILLCDPLSDSQALKEAFESHLPIISIVGSESPLTNIDVAIPANNKGRKSLALIMYLLAREFLIAKGEITKDAFNATPEDFEQKLEDNARTRKKTFSSGFRGSSRRGPPRQRR